MFHIITLDNAFFFETNIMIPDIPYKKITVARDTRIWCSAEHIFHLPGLFQKIGKILMPELWILCMTLDPLKLYPHMKFHFNSIS